MTLWNSRGWRIQRAVCDVCEQGEASYFLFATHYFRLALRGRHGARLLQHLGKRGEPLGAQVAEQAPGIAGGIIMTDYGPLIQTESQYWPWIIIEDATVIINWGPRRK